MTCLRLEGISARRGVGQRAVQVLRELSLEITPGEIVLLEGPSGSGKTTVLGVAAGLIAPDRGGVVLGGQPFTTLPLAQQRGLRARHLGLVFQRASLLGGVTVKENILLMGTLAGMTRSEAGAEADRLLANLRLTALAGRRPDELSGGEEQRVAVARALVHRPAIVLADEPTGNLDDAAGQGVAEALVHLARARGAAVLVATHDARLAPFATRRLRLVNGQARPGEGEDGAAAG